jgi:hypothetical protein
MSFAIATRAEVLKTKRTASVWLTVLGAGFIPSLFFFGFIFKPGGAIKQLAAAPWTTHFMWGWYALSSFLFPMYIILICSLIPQIEYKNNTWKQVFAAPQSVGTIFFSKFLTIQFMIVFFFLLFNGFMLGCGILANLFNPKFTFLDHTVPWSDLVKLNLKTYISILGISAIQYAVSLRFKNFITPIGIGLALLIAALLGSDLHWSHIFKMPYAHPLLTLKYMAGKTGLFWKTMSGMPSYTALRFWLLVFWIHGFVKKKVNRFCT